MFTRSLSYRFTRALLVLALFLASAAFAQDYFPHRDGLSWTYSNGETQTLSGPQEIAGEEVMVLTHVLDGNVVSKDYLGYDDIGVFSYGTEAGGQTLLYDPPLTLYAGNSLQVGQSWQSATNVAGIEITLAAEVVGMRGIRTELGRFNALQVRQRTFTNTGAQTTLDLYVVPGIGVVRFETQDGTTVDLVEKNF